MVRIATVRLWPYSVPLEEPWCSRRSVIHRRDGWLVRVETDDGAHGWGETAVLTELGTEAKAEAGEALAAASARLAGLQLEMARRALPGFDRPAARCGIEAALLDLEARRAGLPLHQLLRQGSRPLLSVNASCGPVDQGLGERLAAAAAAGFEIAKIKLATRPVAIEWSLLAAELARAPQTLGLRFDLNGAWDIATARQWLPSLAQWRTECVEEPVHDAEPLMLARLQAICPFALALDESIAGLADDAPLPVRRQMLKPMVLGGAERALALAARRGTQSVVTSALETAVGLWHAAHLAAAIDATAQRPLAHGLDTGRWLARALGPLPPRAGHWRLGDAPGLGIEPELP